MELEAQGGGGMKSEAVDDSLSAIGIWLSAVVCRLLAFGCPLSAER